MGFLDAILGFFAKLFPSLLGKYLTAKGEVAFGQGKETGGAEATVVDLAAARAAAQQDSAAVGDAVQAGRAAEAAGRTAAAGADAGGDSVRPDVQINDPFERP